MAAIHRPTQANYVVNEVVSVETEDNEDHTFCGIMFPVKCKDLLPLDHIVITSVAVRGKLGPLTVWVSNSEASNHQFLMNQRHWTKVYERTHPPSRHVLVPLSIAPIVLYPGQTKAIYIHSSLPGDEAIVYDNQRRRQSSANSTTTTDLFAKVLTGRAHVSNEVFGSTPIWGWGNPWRDAREFVGRLEYGAVYQLWNPQTRMLFGNNFQTMARTLWLCQRRPECVMSRLPDDVICYILNMCRWDWAMDNKDTMKQQQSRRKCREMARAAAAATTATATVPAAATATGCCQRTCIEREDDMLDEEENDEEGEVEDEYEADSIDEESDEEWDSDSDHNAPVNVFTFRDEDSDVEEEQVQGMYGRPWMLRSLARVQVLQAMAMLEDGGVVNRRNDL